MIRSERHWEGDTVIAVDIVDDGIESLLSYQLYKQERFKAFYSSTCALIENVLIQKSNPISDTLKKPFEIVMFLSRSLFWVDVQFSQRKTNNTCICRANVQQHNCIYCLLKNREISSEIKPLSLGYVPIGILFHWSLAELFGIYPKST